MDFTGTHGECVKWIEKLTMCFSGGLHKMVMLHFRLTKNAKLLYQQGK